MKGMPSIRHALRSPVFAVGGNDPVSLEALPTRVFGRIAHLLGFVIDVTVTPSYTTAPTIAGIHSLIKSLVFFDGIGERLNLSGFDIRLMEILENGRRVIPDPPTNNGTGNAVTFRLVVGLGPPNYAGSPSDFMLPCAALKNGELRFTFGALTDYSADTTALNSVNIRLGALVGALDNEIRVAPAFERRAFNYSTNDALIQGNALYCAVGIAKQNYAAFAAGDLNEITIDGGQGASNSVLASTLEAAAHFDLRAGHVTQLAGEPRNANDVDARTINLGTPTAIAPSDRTIQAVCVSPDETRISKILYEATSGLRIKYTGTFTTPRILVGRILEQPRASAAAIAARAIAELRLPAPKSAKVKTLSKMAYSGPREAYLPWSFTW